MAGDLIQHRVNNYDWDDDWIYSDKRLNLLQCEDEQFLRFLCEMIHPLVRTDQHEIGELLNSFNLQLEPDGLEIYESRRTSNRPIFSARPLVTSPTVKISDESISSLFVKEQLEKADAKIAVHDYDGAITNARTLVEGVFDEIHRRCMGQALAPTGSLLSDYKRVKDLLNLSEDRYVHEGLKGLVRSFNGIIDGIDSLSNKLGDRHRPILKPQRHHAKLVVDGAKTICDFLYSTLEYQSIRKNALRDELLTILNSNKRSLSRTKLLADAEIKKIMSSCDSFLRRLIKDDLIHDYPVDSYRKSDIVFAMLRLFVDELTASDIGAIFVESQQNDQMIGWKAFQAELQTMKPGLLQEAMDEIYGDQNE
jgi:AbiJ N-terminal domain 3/Abortive infection C-terminus